MPDDPPPPAADPASEAPARAAKPRPALPPLVTDLVTRHGYPLLDDGAAEPWRHDGRPWVVFLPGHGKGSAETADVAVILPELVRAYAPRLTPAVAGEAAERALLARLGMMGLPALVFLRGGDTLGSIPRVRDWSDYRARIDAILAGAAAAPSGPLQ